MPKQKKNGKWYYGSVGPYDTEAKLNEVIRAMHASGYKGHDKKKKKGKNN